MDIEAYGENGVRFHGALCEDSMNLNLILKSVGLGDTEGISTSDVSFSLLDIL